MVHIEDLDLSFRAYNVLRREGLSTTEDLVLLSESDLLDMRNMGSAGVDDVKRALAAVGLKLRD